MPPDHIDTIHRRRSMSEEELAEEAYREAMARWRSYVARLALEEMAQEREREAS